MSCRVGRCGKEDYREMQRLASSDCGIRRASIKKREESEKTPSSWEKILRSMEWHLSQGPESCMGILALSYRDLPYFLKSCFLYCVVFPEDCEIKASTIH